MAVYTASKDTTSDNSLENFDLNMFEWEMYGSNRLGVVNRANANAEVGYGGINETPRTFNAETGLSAAEAAKKP